MNTSNLCVFANTAAASDAPPNFVLAATIPVIGAVSSDSPSIALSRNGLICAVILPTNVVGALLLAVFTRPSVASQAWAQVASITGPPQSYFGNSMSMSADGAVMAVGESQANNLNGSTSILSFNVLTGRLALEATVVGTGAAGAARQGTAVALSGDGATLAVGGVYDNNQHGAVWMFKKTPGQGWTQVGSKLAPFNASQNSITGASLALSFDGTTLAIASAYNRLVLNTGCVYMYNFVPDTGSWVQGQTIYPLGATPPQAYLTCVKLNDAGDVLVIDQPANNDGEGGVAVYNKQSNGLWVQNGAIRVATGALVPTVGAHMYLAAMSPTGSMFALATAVSATPPSGPLVLSLFR